MFVAQCSSDGTVICYGFADDVMFSYPLQSGHAAGFEAAW